MSGHLLIDGYNVINSWKEFESLRKENLEHAREILVQKVAEYSAFKGFKTQVVFDAMNVSGDACAEKISGIEVIYTGEDETADSWIERRAHELGREKAKFFVVTSDYAEQLNVLGSGGHRISAREFHEDYLKAKKDISERLTLPKKLLNRNELGGRVSSDVLAVLEQMRRDKN
ncbi:MAG: NYN domain-containing protein [Phascolarctobacterium sp.]|nr:NYN domain-containing protein [Phascolarctobacterium sp.]